jgi:hypothetical protein
MDTSNLFLMHIPRTATTSLFYAARKRPCGYMSNRNDWYDGHAVWTEIPRDKQILVMLRDPVDRMASHFKMLAGTKTVPEHTLMSKGIVQVFSEYQPTPWNRSQRPWLKPNPNIAVRMLAGAESDYEQMIETAKQNLDQCLWFGITEKFAQSIDRLNELFQWNLPIRYDNKLDRPILEITNEEKAQLRELGKYDQQLYEYALEKFG